MRRWPLVPTFAYSLAGPRIENVSRRTIAPNRQAVEAMTWQSVQWQVKTLPSSTSASKPIPPQ